MLNRIPHVLVCPMALLLSGALLAVVDSRHQRIPRKNYGRARSPLTWTSHDARRDHQQIQIAMIRAAQILGVERLPATTRIDSGSLTDERPFSETMDGRSLLLFKIPAVEIALPEESRRARHLLAAESTLLFDVNLILDCQTHQLVLAYSNPKGSGALPPVGADLESFEITGGHISGLKDTRLESTVREILATLWDLDILPGSQGQLILRPRRSDISWGGHDELVRPWWIVEVLGAEGSGRLLHAEPNTMLVQIEDRDRKNYIIRSVP